MTMTKTKTFPTLYSLNTNGSVQAWTISVNGTVITKCYGRVGGAMQNTTDVIRSGKNKGRANETSAEEQALLEATSAWEKKQKSGYVSDLKAAQAGAVSAAHIAGGIEPMLAHKWSEHSHKIAFPAFMQPKLDGIRCIAMITNGKCTLWTRTRKQIKSVPHIVEALELAFAASSTPIVLDGELYNHALREQFEQIVSLVRKDKPDPRCDTVQYHIYDAVMPGNYAARHKWLSALRGHACFGKALQLVTTAQVDTPEEAIQFFTDMRHLGYEGAMIRNNAPYEHKRSYNIQKIKEFDDSEFKIVGVEAGRGRMSDCAVFVCQTKKGEEFRCKMEGALETLKVYLSKPKSVIGKLLTVRYQGLTNGGIPRFPVGVVVRDYE